MTDSQQTINSHTDSVRTKPAHFSVIGYRNQVIAVRETLDEAIVAATGHLMRDTDTTGVCINPESSAVYIRPSLERVPVPPEQVPMPDSEPHVLTCGRSDDIKVGVVVELKSGGPRMTVTRWVDPDMVECTWFTSNVTSASVKVDHRALRRAD